jgi:hypothetical protein
MATGSDYVHTSFGLLFRCPQSYADQVATATVPYSPTHVVERVQHANEKGQLNLSGPFRNTVV